MAVQANPYLVITDGTITVTILDGSGGTGNYPLAYDRWAPSVPGLERSEFGGRGTHEDGEEQLEITPLDTTAALAYNRLQVLARLLDQAERFAAGYNVAPVLLKYCPKGSTVASTAAPYQALILGRALGDQTRGVQIGGRWDDVGLTFMIDVVTVRLRRAGWWIGADVAANSSATANPGPITATLTTHPQLSPTKLKLNGFAANRNFMSDASYVQTNPILIVGPTAAISVVEAEGATATAYTSVADSAHFARGGNHLRYTPTGTGEAASGYLTGTLACRHLGVYAKLRNNGATTYKIRVAGYIATDDSGAPVVYAQTAVSQLVPIDASHANARHVFLGSLRAPLGRSIEALKLLITASAAASSLDIDYLVLVALDDPGLKVATLIPNNGMTPFPHAWSLTIDDQALTGLTPQVYVTDETLATDLPLGYEGDPLFLASLTTCTVVLMAHSDNGNWVFTSSGGGAAVSNLTLTATRHNAYLVPE